MSNWLIPPRIDAPELLDAGLGHPADVRKSYQDLWRVNTWLGGVWSITRHLYPRLRATDGPVSVLDVGAGAADVAAVVSRWAAAQQREVTVIPLDVSTWSLDLARQADKRLVPLQADALRLPFAPGSVDYVMSSLFLHHLPPAVVTQLLRACWQVARRGVLMSDLQRGRVNEWAWHATLPFFARSHITYHDGLASIKRAYRPIEFSQMAHTAEMKNVKLDAPLPWRMTLIADKEPYTDV